MTETKAYRKVGFTGTQSGMTKKQKKAFVKLILSFSLMTFNHGDCIGADADAHDLVVEHTSYFSIGIYPPINVSKCAWKQAPMSIRYPPKEYLARNRDIVDASQVLIATPKEVEEQLRSGTWSTVRYAKKQKIPVYIIFPDGSVREELPK